MNLVRQKNRGAPRFIYVCIVEDTILFKDIHAKAEKLDITGQKLDENECFYGTIQKGKD